MQGCCFDHYGYCGSLCGCFQNIAIQVPSGYDGAFITLLFTKYGSPDLVFRASAEVIGGNWAVLEADDLISGFFNPYARYGVAFYDVTGEQRLEFAAVDGQTYNGIDFGFDYCTGDINTVVLNAINSAIYD